MKKEFIDHLGNKININFPPKRIVSIVPSQTELLFDLGLGDEIVGISKFCIHPGNKYKATTKVGGTKTLKMDIIEALHPDLIIGNKEENNIEDITFLQTKYPVWMSDIYTLEDALKTISDIAELVDREAEASYLNYLISSGFNDLRALSQRKKIKKSVAYTIWKDPYMYAGKHTFIDDLMERIGLQNVVTENRYPILELSALLLKKPDYVLLSSEPYPFKEQHIAEVQQALPDAKIILVDGEMFSWYGSRLVKAVQYFFELQNKILNI